MMKSLDFGELMISVWFIKSNIYGYIKRLFTGLGDHSATLSVLFDVIHTLPKEIGHISIFY
jgi:hypothetical protein